ncbi:hypothetical protein R1sor_019080 [Riccia sorocarpa]|uniref:adenylate kinase n=1 Tax=Riccia sorocarpa TaxID=122646 RepID=A0ABD3IBL9_9MARC
MGCRQSTLATEPNQIKKSKEADDALEGSPRVELAPSQANRPQSADGVRGTDSPRDNTFKLQPIPPFAGGPQVGQLPAGSGKSEKKTEHAVVAAPPPAKPPPLRRLKSALKSASKNFDKPAGIGSISTKRTVVFVLGGPGCGKGTQCERIVKEFGFVHLSAGDLLRLEVKKASPLGKKCDALMKEGKLVPVEITLGLIEKAMKASGKKLFLIDGFPRAIDQAKAFEAKICRPDKVLFLECPKEVMQQRLLKRGESSGRSDDNEATIIKRFETFEKESLPVIGHYNSIDKNIVSKVSSVPPPDQVYKTIQEILRKTLEAQAST